MNRNEHLAKLVAVSGLFLLLFIVHILVSLTRKSSEQIKLRKLYDDQIIFDRNLPIKIGPFFGSLASEWNRPSLVDILNPNECLEMIELGSRHLEMSKLVGVGEISNVRLSLQAFITILDQSHSVQKFVAYAEQITRYPRSCFESIQFLKYFPGMFYKAHDDSVCESIPEARVFFSHGGHRVRTILMYLNSDFEGGETYFPRIDTKFKPGTGQAVVFEPMIADGTKCAVHALHSALPVLSGVKYAATIWVRERGKT